MGNCAGYCTGENEEKNEHHIKNSFNQKDLQVGNDNNFEAVYGKFNFKLICGEADKQVE